MIDQYEKCILRIRGSVHKIYIETSKVDRQKCLQQSKKLYIFLFQFMHYSVWIFEKNVLFVNVSFQEKYQTETISNNMQFHKIK